MMVTLYALISSATILNTAAAKTLDLPISEPPARHSIVYSDLAKSLASLEGRRQKAEGRRLFFGKSLIQTQEAKGKRQKENNSSSGNETNIRVAGETINIDWKKKEKDQKKFSHPEQNSIAERGMRPIDSSIARRRHILSDETKFSMEKQPALKRDYSPSRTSSQHHRLKSDTQQQKLAKYSSSRTSSQHRPLKSDTQQQKLAKYSSSSTNSQHHRLKSDTQQQKLAKYSSSRTSSQHRPRSVNSNAKTTPKSAKLFAIAQSQPKLSTPAPSNRPVKKLSDLNPNSNPLSLPSQPQEVEIQKTVPLTLKEAIELAKRNNRQLQVTRLQQERNRANLSAEEAALFPTIKLEANGNRQSDASGELSADARKRQLRKQVSESESLLPRLQQQIGQTTNPTEQLFLEQQIQQAQGTRQQLNNTRNFATTNLTGGLNLEYAIFAPGRQASIAAAKEQLRFSELEVQRIEEQLRLDIATAYYDLQQADREVAIAQDDVNSRTESLKSVEQLFNAKFATKLDLLNPQVELGNARQILRNAQARQETARRNLAQLLSLPSVITPIAADSVDITGKWNLPLSETIILALKNRVELDQQLAQRRNAQAQRQIALSEIRPNVGLVANYNVLQAYSDQSGDDVSRGFGDGYSIGVRANWTLFDGGAAKSRAKGAEADIKIAEQQFADNTNRIRLEVETAFYQLPATLQNVDTATEAVQLAKEAVQAASDRFKASVNTQTEVLDAQNRLVQAENNRVQAVLGYNRALATLQKAVGSEKG
jgi:outer membrane protein TolC